MKKTIVIAVCALAVIASFAPATASARWLSKSEAAWSIDKYSPRWFASRPAWRWCTRFTANKVACVSEHFEYDCVANITVTARGGWNYVSRPRNVSCY